jgi:hypothetical protein
LRQGFQYCEQQEYNRRLFKRSHSLWCMPQFVKALWSPALSYRCYPIDGDLVPSDWHCRTLIRGVVPVTSRWRLASADPGWAEMLVLEMRGLICGRLQNRPALRHKHQHAPVEPFYYIVIQIIQNCPLHPSLFPRIFHVSSDSFLFPFLCPVSDFLFLFCFFCFLLSFSPFFSNSCFLLSRSQWEFHVLN